MTGMELPGASTIVRYVGFTRIRGNRVDGSAFCRRPGESGLSINWLDYFADLAKERQLDLVRQSAQISLGARAVFAELNVGETRQQLSDTLPGLRFVHSPAPATDRYPADPSHSEILGLPPAETEDMALLIGDMIAQQVKVLHPALSG